MAPPARPVPLPRATNGTPWRRADAHRGRDVVGRLGEAHRAARPAAVPRVALVERSARAVRSGPGPSTEAGAGACGDQRRVSGGRGSVAIRRCYRRAPLHSPPWRSWRWRPRVASARARDPRRPRRLAPDPGDLGRSRAPSRRRAGLGRLVRRRRCAAVGLEHVELLETAGHPSVYGDWLHAPGAPTVLVYGHHDVQPVDPLDAWMSPPFEPTVRDGQLFARGAVDDKGQVLYHLEVVRALLGARRRACRSTSSSSSRVRRRSAVPTSSRSSSGTASGCAPTWWSCRTPRCGPPTSRRSARGCGVSSPSTSRSGPRPATSTRAASAARCATPRTSAARVASALHDDRRRGSRSRASTTTCCR